MRAFKRQVLRPFEPTEYTVHHHQGWLGSGVVSELDSGAEGPGFKSQSRRCRVTVLGKLFTPIVPLFTKHQKLVAALSRVAGGNCRPGGKKCQLTAGFMSHVTCRLTTKNRYQLRNPTLGNRVWATCTFFTSSILICLKHRIRSRSLTIQTGQPGLKACTSICPKIK